MDQKTEDLKCADQEAIDQKYMREAIKQAKKAYALEEVPIGCVIVYDGKIIGRGYNRRTIDKNPLAHAEIHNPESEPKDGRLAAGRLHIVCNIGTVSNVFRRDRAGADQTGGRWLYESESGMRRFDFKFAGCERI